MFIESSNYVLVFRTVFYPHARIPSLASILCHIIIGFPSSVARLQFSVGRLVFVHCWLLRCCPILARVCLRHRRRHEVQLHQHLHVDGQTREAVVRVRVHRQPRQHVVALQHVAQHVGGERRVERMVVGRLRLVLLQQVVVVLLHRRAVQVEGGLQEHRAHVLQVRARRPEPVGHAAGGGGADQVAEGERLLQQVADLAKSGNAKRWLENDCNVETNETIDMCCIF